MNTMRRKSRQRCRRARRVRRRLRGTPERPRLSVFRSGRHISCQIIDDTCGRTLAAASSLASPVRESGTSGSTCEGAAAVGCRIAEVAVEAGIKSARFDRGPYKYHGRVKALAEAARAGGLSF